MKTTIKPLIGLFLMGTLLISCDENEEKTIETITETGILQFDSQDSYESELKTVLELDEEQLNQWEKEKEFSSRGVSALRSYQSATSAFEKDSITETLIQTVNNNEHLCLIEDDNGEISLEVTINNNPNRFFANSEGLFIIGDSVVKVFNNYTIISNQQNLSLIRSLDEENISDLKNNLEFIVISHNTASNKTLRSSSCDVLNKTGIEGRKTDGRYRVKVEIISSEIYFSGYVTNGYVGGRVRSYKKTAGIWFYKKTNLTAYGAIAYKEKKYNTWRGSYVAEYGPGTTYNTKLEFFVLGQEYNYTNSTPKPNLEITGYNYSGGSNKVSGSAKKQCNASATY